MGAAGYFADFPFVRASAQRALGDVSSGDHNLASYEIGDLLVLAFWKAGTGGTTGTPAGWTLVHTINTYDRLVLFKRVVTEDIGTTVNISTGQAIISRSICYSVGGHKDGELEFAARTAASATHPRVNNLTPSWGAKKTLWIAVNGRAPVSGDLTNYPSDYVNTRTVSNNLAAGTRQLEAASERASAFVWSAAANCTLLNIAIRPRG